MPIENENRVFAAGMVTFHAGAPTFVGRHPGLNAAIADLGVGLCGFALSGEVPAGGVVVRGNVAGPLGGFIQQNDPTGAINTRAFVVKVFDDAGVAADLPFTITIEQIPPQS